MSGSKYSARVQKYDGRPRESSGNFEGDLGREFRPINLRTLWLMMTGWGKCSERQERYRQHFQPRWPAPSMLSGNTFEE